jgi:hypothetical protein
LIRRIVHPSTLATVKKERYGFDHHLPCFSRQVILIKPENEYHNNWKVILFCEHRNKDGRSVIKTIGILLGFCLLFAIGCTSSRGGLERDQTVGNVIRAPVDLVSAIGREIAGKKFAPGREFRQNWQSNETDPVFWEEDEVFFSSP